MASNIQYTGIDEEFPVAGQDNDSQGFRDNFSKIKTALGVASSEIGQFLDEGARKDVNNDFNGNTLSNATLLQITDKVFNTGNINSNAAISWDDGSFQNVTVSADVTLTLSNWPQSGDLGRIILAIRSDGNARTINWEADNGGVIRFSPNWPTGDFTVSSLTNPTVIEVWTSDSGATVYASLLGTLGGTPSRIIYENSNAEEGIINANLYINGTLRAENIDLTSAGGTVANLYSIGDVDATNPNDGDYLVWNDTTNRWTATTVTLSGLASLADVELTGPSTNQVLSFDGTDWRNRTIGEFNNQITVDSDTVSASSRNIVFADGTGAARDLKAAGAFAYTPSTGTLSVGSISISNSILADGDSSIIYDVASGALTGTIKDDSGNTIINAADGKVTPGSFQLPSVTTSERDSSYTFVGSMVYNTTDLKVQAYQSSGWFNVDGT